MQIRKGLYPLAATVIAISAWTAYEPRAQAQGPGSCCTYTSECGGGQWCCKPTGGTANCSPSQANYCSTSSCPA